MKTNTTIRNTMVGTLPWSLLAATLAFTPLAAEAHSHGSFGFGGGGGTRAFEPWHGAPGFSGESRRFASPIHDFRNAHELIDGRLGRLNESWAHRDRLDRSRAYLYGLVDLGTPDYLIDDWTDAMADDEIVAGMPTDLVLDYWGTPLATDPVMLASGPAEVWTYRERPEHTVKVTVSHRAVLSVRHL